MRKVFLEGSLDIVLPKLFILQMKKLGLRIFAGRVILQGHRHRASVERTEASPMLRQYPGSTDCQEHPGLCARVELGGGWGGTPVCCQ